MKQRNSVEKALMNQRITTTYLWCLQCFDAVGWAAEMPGHVACKKTELWGAGKVICLEWGADLHTVQLMPLPFTVSCFSKIQTGFTFLVPAHLGSPEQRAIKWVCVCVCLWCILKCSRPAKAAAVKFAEYTETLSCLFLKLFVFSFKTPPLK